VIGASERIRHKAARVPIGNTSIEGWGIVFSNVSHPFRRNRHQTIQRGCVPKRARTCFAIGSKWGEVIIKYSTIAAQWHDARVRLNHPGKDFSSGSGGFKTRAGYDRK
jgi:hypothetical protein